MYIRPTPIISIGASRTAMSSCPSSIGIRKKVGPKSIIGPKANIASPEPPNIASARSDWSTPPCTSVMRVVTSCTPPLSTMSMSTRETPSAEVISRV
jgi:hypothetical protein